MFGSLKLNVDLAPAVHTEHDLPAVSSSSSSSFVTSDSQRTLTGYYDKWSMDQNVYKHEYTKQFKTNRVVGPPPVRRDSSEYHKFKAQKRKQEEMKEEENDDDVSDDDDVKKEDEQDENGAKKQKTGTETALVVKEDTAARLRLEQPGDAEKEGLTVYYEDDEKRGKRIARYEAIEPKVITHIKELYDYQGRSFLHDPLRSTDQTCFLPKKHIHTWRGHNKPVASIHWFPPHGHLLMSAGMDNKVKLWDVMGKRNVVQTYIGHSKAVKDTDFSWDGNEFISIGYDRFIRIWDTETGKVNATFSTGKQPYCCKFFPDESKGNIILCGMGDKKIVQWDLRTGRIVQEYDQHLGPVNTITFIDNNRRFVTTSDDKTMRVWEFDIPVVIKYMADPSMHSLPTGSMHPTEKFVCYQSMDNQIVTYMQTEKFRPVRKKTFKGHVCAGYACQIGFSPDGKFVCSGDGEGNVWFWEWKTCKILKKFKAHDKVCIGCLWHPVEQSKIATAGWDHQIKFWD
eukprot:TRINITY_DN12254_c0_g1_i1.p1 TRINITY_DN12254_c0_g1~~TRINITY_DN12254_c0_g1_i1.p1  ORF type:complete len:521 (-),score=54.83 TRINITY_DN12254_c0_g1_i1:154-1686(-)